MVGARALHEGDDVLAGADSVAELHHFDGSSTRLDAGATAALERIADPDGRPHLLLRLGPGNSFHRTAVNRSRGGQYEVRTPSAVALARTATFVAHCGEDGAAAFTALTGTVVVRGTAGATVVLRAGETVGVGIDGTVGEVAGAPADDEWVEVNAFLDADEAAARGTAASTATADHAEAAPPAPAPTPPADELDDAEDGFPFVPEPDDHPWKVGLAATVAISIGIFSVVIGRAGSARPVEDGVDPGVALAGPPAFAGPAFTTPAFEEPADTPPRTLDASPPTTAAPAPTTTASVAVPEVVGRTCSRNGGTVITYTGSVRNRSSRHATYTIRVRFIGARDTTVGSVTTTVHVPANASKTFRVASQPLANARAATACDAAVVDQVA